MEDPLRIDGRERVVVPPADAALLAVREDAAGIVGLAKAMDVDERACRSVCCQYRSPGEGWGWG